MGKSFADDTELIEFNERTSGILEVKFELIGLKDETVLRLLKLVVLFPAGAEMEGRSTPTEKSKFSASLLGLGKKK